MVVIAFVTCFGVAGCGRSDRKLPGWVDGKKNLIFYIFDEVPFYQSVAQRFNQLEGNEDVNVVILKSGTTYFDDLILSYAGAQTPDIVFMQMGDILPFLNGRNILLEPLDEYLAESEVLKESDLWPANDGYRYNEQTKNLDSTSKSNKLYSIIKDFSPDFPLTYNKAAMLAATSYNSEDETLPTVSTETGETVQISKKTIRDKLNAAMENGYPAEIPAGGSALDYTLTWDEYNALALAMKNLGASSGAVLDGAPELQILQWIEMSGETLFDEDNNCRDIKNTPGIRKAFDNFRILQERQNSAAPWVNGSQPGYAQFRDGLEKLSSGTASTFYGRWAYSQFGWDQSLDKIGYCAPPLPADYEAGNLSSAIGGAMGLSITSKCQYKEEAWDFIEFFMTTIQQEEAAKGFNISGNRTIANEYFANAEGSAEYKALNSFYFNLSQNSQTLHQNPYISQSKLKSIMWYHFEGYFYGTSTASWETVLDNIRNEINTEIAKARA